MPERRDVFPLTHIYEILYYTLSCVTHIDLGIGFNQRIWFACFELLHQNLTLISNLKFFFITLNYLLKMYSIETKFSMLFFKENRKFMIFDFFPEFLKLLSKVCENLMKLFSSNEIIFKQV